MSDQFSTAGTAGLIRSLTEKNILSCRECTGAERPVKGIGLRIDVHTDPAEVGAQGAFHLAADSAVEAVAPASLLLNRVFHVRRHSIVRVFLVGSFSS